MPERMKDALALGQSMWLDFIRRDHTRGGELAALIGGGLRGITSNPTIFEKAISSGPGYDAAILELLPRIPSVPALYEALAIEDVRDAADLLEPVHSASAGQDGHVSLEVSPALAHDRSGTVAEAKRLFASLGRANAMIKIPATPAGIEASAEVIAAGINVNVTLIFTQLQAAAVARAYLQGLKALRASGRPLDGVASVASVFISRLDAKLAPVIDRLGAQGVPLRDRLAVANAAAIDGLYRKAFSGGEWERLVEAGAKPQRLLWASTGVKDPGLPDTYYLEALMAPGTVNTVPPATLAAFLDHGSVADRWDGRVEASRDLLRSAAILGVDLDQAGRELLAEGLASFAASFQALLNGLEAKRARLQGL